ncbi:hypothetical protein H6G76_21470 [Nostoc sp. FACHB-152]|uniref:beta strand repeat-containing protein n=1 Tax=Nostoc sp. FACHB-152 TaxID=2692837 RepID=UPI001683B591|nr:hypothetical protein [Nostoc sp. FACHB-152]MBD2449690.1 hypothetical protein [Nostoc sp. FACHB-152]
MDINSINTNYSGTNSLSSDSSLFNSLDPFAYQLLPNNSLMLLGTDKAENLYLKVGDGQVLEYSADGNYFYQINGLGFSQDTNISVNLGFDKDSLYIDSSLFDTLKNTGAKLNFEGGQGNDTLFGPKIDTTWYITGDNSGNIGNIEFHNVENLKAAANNYATFVFTPEGNLSGVADGGDGNLGTLVLEGGTYNSAKFIADGPHSGEILLDTKTIRYDGLAPIFDNTTTADRVFTATNSNDKILVKKDTIGKTTIFSSNGTFESITFWNPSNSLTIKGLLGNDTITVDSIDANFTKSLTIDGEDGNDSVIFAQNLTLNGGNLTVNAESISILDNVNIFTSGDVSFEAKNNSSVLLNLLPGGIVNTQKAEISLGNNVSIEAENITLKAEAQDDNPTDEINSWVNGFLVQPLIDYGTAIASLPVDFAIRESSASVILGNNAKLTTGGDIEISATAKADSTSKVLNQYFSIGYSSSNATAITTIGQGAIIKAEGDVNILSDANSVAGMTTRTLKNLGEEPTDSTGVGVSIAIANAKLTSKTTVSQGAEIEAGGNVNLVANGKTEREASAEVGSFGSSGRGGISAALGFSKADVNTFVNGKVVSGSSLQHEFNPGSAVNNDNDTITIKNHGFKDGQAVIYKNNNDADSNIGDLEDSTTYYVKVVDENTIQLAESSSDLEDEKFIDLKSTGVQGNAHILKDPGIRVIAQLESEDAADATSGVGGDPSIADKIEKPEIAVSAIIGKLTEDNYSKNSNSGGSGGDASVTAAGAFVFSKIDNNVTATIGSNAVLESQADVSVQASISENIKTAAEAATEDAEGSNGAAKKASASAAVIVGLYSNNAQTTIESNAVIDASKDTRITSEVSYPFRIEPQERFVPSDVGAMLKEEGFGGVTGYLDGKLGIQSELLNSWAVSTSETEGEISLAGSVNYQQFTNNSQAIVKSGAKINQNQDIRPESDDQTVSVEATTEMQLINVTGVFKFDLSIDSVKDLVQKKDPLAIYNPVGSSGGKGGVGGAFFLMFNDSTTIAKVETGTSIYTGADGGLTINAESTAFDVDLGQAGGGGGKFGVGGTFSYTNQESKTIAQLESGAKVTGGSLEITANDETLRITAVGGVAKSENLGIGMSVTVNEMDRETLALIGNQTGTAGIGTDIEVEGDIKVEAKADGGLWAFSLAAAVVKDKPPEKPSEASTDQLASAPQPDLSSAGGSGGSTSSNDQGNQGKSGIGISGDVSINNVKDKVSAYINDAGTIKGETLDITAVNDSDLRSVSGAVSFSAKKDPNSTSAGIAGSFSMNTLTGTTSAYISGSAANGDKLTLEASQLSLSATRSGDLFALSAGGAAAPGQNGYAVSGSVSLNKIANTTEASMSGTNATIAGDVGLNAQDSSSIFAIGGALSFGGKAGFGAAIGLNRINNTTKALIQDSSLDHQGKLELSAINESSIKAITASLGISTQQSSAAGAGTVSLNFISNRTETAIINTQKGASTATGIISLIAKDNSDIANLAGAVGLSGGKAGFGAAVAYNSISNVVKSYIESSTLSTQGELKLQAESKAVIQAIALGVGGGKDVGLGGSVAINLIGNTTEAYLNSVNLTADGQNNISASDNSTIQALAGGVGVGQKAGIGAGIGVNQIGNSIKAYVSNSNLTSNNLVSLSALSTSTIEAISIGGGGSEKFALGGSVSVNTINTVTTAYISNNSVVQGSQVLASALDTSTIKSLSGAVAVSGNTAIGAAVSTNNINNQVVTYISSSQVTATSNNILLKADLKAKISNATLGGAGGQSFALGGSVSVNNINTVTDAHISDNATVNAAQAVEVLANDNSDIESLAGQVAIGGTAGVGAAVSTNNINNNVSADISSSQITSTIGGVKVKAAIAPKINNITVAGAGGGSFALGGSVTVNNIGTQTLAYISNNSTVEASQGVTVLATDNSNINSFAGTIAGSGNTAIGASVSTNNVNNKVSAYISASQVTSTSNVLVNADLTALVRNATVGGAGAGTFAAGGSVSVNNIGTVTEADISDKATVNAAQEVEILANDNSDIESLAGQVVIGGAAGVGASVSTNNVNNKTSAYISDSQVTSSNSSLTVKANSSPKISNITAGGTGGGAFAFGGSVTVNNIGTQTLAYISNNSIIQARQNIEILATNNAAIQSLAGQISAAGQAAIGAAVAVNNYGGKIEAYINDSEATSTSGQIKVTANDTSKIESLSAGASVSGSPAVPSVSLTGSVSVNNISNTVDAHTLNARISANSLEISAKNDATIKSLAGQISISISGGAVGAAVAYNNIGSTVKAYIAADDGNYTTVNTSGNVLVTAVSKGTIETIAAGGSVGLFVGAAGSAAVNQMTNNVSAFVQNGIIKANGSVGILADSNNTMTTKGGTFSGGFVGLGATIAVNNLENKTRAYVNNSSIDGVGEQSIIIPKTDGTGVTESFQGVAVLATSKDNLGVTIGTGGAGGYAFVASIAVNTFKNTTEAYANDVAINAIFGSTVPQHNVYIKAFNDSKVEVNAGTAGVGLAAAAGVGIEVTTMKNATNAYINSSDLINSQGSQIYAHNNLIVEAKTQKSLTSNVMALGGGLGFSVQGAVSIINVSSGMSDKGKEAASDTQSKVDTQLQDLNKMGKDSSGKSNISTKSADFTSSLLNLQGTTAFIAGTANAGNNIIVNAYETTKLNMTVGSLSAGLASVGGAVGIANIQHNASAYVGDRSTLIGGNITIQSTGFVDSTTVEAVAGSAGLVGLGAAVAILSSENNSKAYVGNHTAIIKANNIDVIANSSSNLNVEGLGASYGLAAAGAVIANAQETGTTKAYLDSGIQVENTDNLNVKANTNETVTATTQASSGGIISGNGTDAKATVNPNVAAYIGDNNTIKVTKDINVLSNVSVDGDAASKGGSYGALAVGLSFSEVNSNPTINTYVGANTTIEAGNITISSSLGKAPVSADTSFNPSNAVNNTADSITFANNHGLKTGDTVVYSNGGGNTIGGLTNQTSYKVIAVNDKTVKFGSEFDATTIDTKLNTLKFANGHNFTNNQQVIYEASSGTSNIGGLTSGQKYYVKVIDSNTVQLSKTPIIDDVNEGAKLAGINTVGGVTTITARKDDKTANVFQNGDTVVYKKRSALFTVDTTVPDTGGKANIFNLSTGDIVSQDTINSASHGFETGDQVIYSATGTALSGLTNGQKYYVIKVDDNKFQLGTTYNQATNTVTGIVDITNATAGTSHKITTVGLKISNVTNFTYSTANSNKITVTNHSFTTGQAVKYSGVSSIGLTNGTTYYVIKVDDNNFQLAATSSGTALTLNAGAGSYSLTATTELEENVTYYVKNSTLSDFQLSKTNGGSAIALDTSGLTGTGASHIFVKQSVIDLSSASTGIHNLHLDLENGTATGDKHLLSSGASVVLPSQGDQVFSAYSQASAGALLGGTGTRTNLNITPTSKTYIGNNASLTALGNVTVKSLSNIQVTGATTSETYGAIAVGASEINLTVNTTNNTYVGNAAKIQAQGNVIINAQSDNNLNISASGGAGSLITFADADAIARLKHDTTTTVQDNATIIANDDLVIGSNSNTNGNVKVQASGVGFYADADANGEFYIDGTNRTDINSNAHLEGRTLTIEAIVNNLNVETRSEAEGAGLIGNIDAHSKVELSGTDATVNIGSQAYLKGDYINLNAIYKKVSSNAIAFADCDGLGGDTDSDSRNNMPLSAKVITDSTSTLDVYKLNVKSDLESVSYRTDAHSDKAWELRIWTPFGDIVITMDFGSESKNETFAPTATTNFNSYVNFVARGENPVLVIGTDGQVTQKSNNVTVNFSGNNAIVSDIKTTELGEANFKGSLTDNGKYSIKDPAYDTVQIDNYSANNLIINNIDAINLGAASQFKYIVNGSSTNKSINGSLPINSTLVTINNWGTSNLILQGKIKNPHDRTILYSGGNIFRQGTTQNIVTRDLKMTAAGSIGAINQGIAAELNQGYSPVTANVADSNIYLNVEAQNSTYLNLTAKALDKKPVTVNVQRMTGYTGEVNLEIGQTTDQANAAVNALYQFTDNIDFYQSIMAGNNIVINAGNTTTNINAKTIFTGATGSLNMVTGGWINVNNVTAAINLQKVISYQDAVHLNGWDLTLVDNGLLQAAKDISVTSTNFSMLNNAQLKAKTDVSLLVNNSFQISASSLISDANNVVIQGDYNNQNPAGATINIEGWINAQQMSIITQGNNDIVNIQRLATTTNIYTGGGNDIVNIGSSQNRTNEIQKRLTIYGETQDDLDTLNIDNSGDNSNNVGILTDTSLTGLSTGEGIYYNGFEVLNLKLGIGNDDFTILNTSATTNIDSSSGDDKFRIGTKVDASGSVVDEIVNGVLLPGVNILGTKNITNIKTGTGNDYIQVNRNTAVLNIEGEFGDDTFEVNTPINYSILLNNAQVNLSGNDGNDTTIINGSSLLETINNNGSSVEVVNSRLISLMTNENLVINGNIGSTGSSGGSNNTNSGSDPTLSSLADRTLVTTNTTNTGSNSSLTLLSLFDRNLVNTSSTSTGTGSVIDPLLLALFSR